MIPQIAYASNHIATAQGFLGKLNDAIIFPLITLMMAVALVVFLYGGFEYVKNAANEQGRETGRRHLMWGIVGMLVMLSAFAILTVAAGTFNLQNDLDRVTTPAATTNVNRAPTTGNAGGVTTGNNGGVTTGNTSTGVTTGNQQ